MRLAMLAAFALSSAGCSGIHTGTTVSPASFLLPGIMKNDGSCVTNAPVAFHEISTEFAQAR
jgi:hypothetical protein